MVKCPVCGKDINELDESCPYCHIVFDDMIEEVEEMKEEPEIRKEQNSVNNNEETITNAKCLNFMANLNIILSIICAIVIWVNFSTIEYKTTSKYATSITEINWYGIFGGFGVLIAGFTLFFLLKTVVDIYGEVEK